LQALSRDLQQQVAARPVPYPERRQPARMSWVQQQFLERRQPEWPRELQVEEQKQLRPAHRSVRRMEWPRERAISAQLERLPESRASAALRQSPQAGPMVPLILFLLASVLRQQVRHRNRRPAFCELSRRPPPG
jgi:hypothetical protein